MKYNFDKVIDRSNSYSIKYEPTWRGKPADVLPLWVADMDFASPPCVQKALAHRVKHGIYGYSEPDKEYFDVIRKWFETRYNWSPQREWLTITPGVVNALYIAVRSLTEPGDNIVIQQPVYYPFESSIRKTGRQLLVNELVYSDGRYSIDFQDFEEKIKQAKMFILCNPHNPVGRVWKTDELTRMGEICLRYGVTVIADEIHQDFVFKARLSDNQAGHKHIVFAAMNQDFANITVTNTSPSKTFNLAGLMSANIFISNKDLRLKFKDEYARSGLSQPGIMGLISCKAAYKDGAQWLEQLIDYLAGNIAFLKTYLAKHIPKIKLVEPEGTYLAWLDCNSLGVPTQKIDETITQKGKLWLSAGQTFGKGGKGFERINVACPRSVLRNALDRLKSIDWESVGKEQ